MIHMKKGVIYVIAFSFILSMLPTNNLYAKSIFTFSSNVQYAKTPTANSLTKFNTAISNAMTNLDHELSLVIPNSSFSSYINSLNDLNGLNSYHVTYVKGPSTSLVKITLDYKQAYKVTQSLKNPNIKHKLSDSDNKLLTTANSIVKQIIKPNMNEYEKELAIHDYIVNNTRYDYDRLQTNTLPNESFTAAGVLFNKVAVCQGYSEATKLLLNLAGIECEIVTGTSSRNVSHAWNIVKINNEWYMLDTTYDDPVTSSDHEQHDTISHDYFNVTNTVLMKDHKWNVSKWPKATSTTYNYYNVSSKIINSYEEFKSYVISQIQAGKKEITCYVNNYDQNTYDLSFIFNYYQGDINYITPQTTSGSYKILLV